MTDSILVHGTCVLIGGDSGEGVGVLLRGSSGAGKSDLALRLISTSSFVISAKLVADDQVCLKSEAGKLNASAPAPLRGLLEVRGLGLAVLPFAPCTELGLIVDLVPRDAVPRLPDPRFESLAGVRLPVIKLYAFDASTAEKVRLAAETIPKNGFPGDDGRLL